jgi:hypothetical protein
VGTFICGLWDMGGAIGYLGPPQAAIPCKVVKCAIEVSHFPIGRGAGRAAQVRIAAACQGQIQAASVDKSGAACQPGTVICAFRLL